MPRVARLVVPGLAHHITQRGNNRQAVFFTDDDRRLYLTLLKEHAQRFDLSVLAYCLMANHVHLVVVPRTAESLARAIGRTHWRYSQAINRLHRRSGHLWQNRFFSCTLDGEHLLHGVCYAERNPVRARLVRLAWRYRWSSAAVHVGEREDAIGVLDDAAWRRMFEPDEWRQILQRPEDARMLERLRCSARTGRALGGDSWLSKLETKLNRRLRALPVGRPAKRTDGGRTRRRRRRRRQK